MLTRRDFFIGAGVAAMGAATSLSGVASLSATPLLPRRSPIPEGGGHLHDLVFTAEEREGSLLGPDGPRSRMWTYSGDPLLPLIRMRLGDRIRARLDNRLSEHTSIHWHGLRVPNDQDGVQYLTQPPVEPGESFTYEFTPPDPGTFFFHPHCNETGQIGRGMVGVLVVEGDEPDPSDVDLVLAYKDWRLNPDGSWLPFETASGASRAGTFGTVRTVNHVADFARIVPAGADVRLRILNLDPTRVLEIGVEGAEAFVVATDGHAVAPFALESWKLGTAMRIDLLVRTPPAGQIAKVIDYFGAELFTLATLRSEGEPRRKGAFRAKPLFAPLIPTPDLTQAERLSFSFSATAGSPGAMIERLPGDDPLATVILDSLCVSERTFWAINKVSWSDEGHRTLPPPVAQLEAGRTYVFELMNATPHPHPIHLHGHVFQVLSASRQNLPRFLADTVLLQPKERIEIAFVAEKGDWMFHCHILEHLEHGMMGWVRVS